MTFKTQGLALLDAGGRVIGAFDSACDIFTNQFRQFRPARQIIDRGFLCDYQLIAPPSDIHVEDFDIDVEMDK